MDNYTTRHAIYLTLITGGGVSLWIVFCFALGLPFHPWSSLAVAGFVGVSLFFFSGLDPVGVRILNSLFNLWSLLLLVCVCLAAVFGARGGAFPRWALIPLLIVGGLWLALVIFFGLRSIVRLLRRRPDMNEFEHMAHQHESPDEMHADTNVCERGQ